MELIGNRPGNGDSRTFCQLPVELRHSSFVIKNKNGGPFFADSSKWAAPRLGIRKLEGDASGTGGGKTDKGKE